MRLKHNFIVHLNQPIRPLSSIYISHFSQIQRRSLIAGDVNCDHNIVQFLCMGFYRKFDEIKCGGTMGSQFAQFERSVSATQLSQNLTVRFMYLFPLITDDLPCCTYNHITTGRSCCKSMTKHQLEFHMDVYWVIHSVRNKILGSWELVRGIFVFTFVVFC